MHFLDIFLSIPSLFADRVSPFVFSFFLSSFSSFFLIFDDYYYSLVTHPTPSSSHRHPTTTYNYDDNVVVVGVVYTGSALCLPRADYDRCAPVVGALSQEMTAFFSFLIFL
jgi:Zn-dependent M28 family amino/carboxypeptidase